MGVRSYRMIRIQIREARQILSPWCPFLPSWEGGLAHYSMSEKSVDQIIRLSSSRVLRPLSKGRSINVNGVPAFISGSTFQALNVPLAVGANTIMATAVDLAGNTAAATITVTGQNGGGG